MTVSTIGFLQWMRALKAIRARVESGQVGASERSALLRSIAEIEDDLDRSWKAHEQGETRTGGAVLERRRNRLKDEIIHARIAITSGAARSQRRRS